MEQEMITLPHPRLTFRRFVLQPVAEIAPKMIHPTIGWPIERFLLHLDSASDTLAIVSPTAARRLELNATLSKQFGAKETSCPQLGAAINNWPAEWTTWLAMETPQRTAASPSSGSKLAYAAATFPKLTILIDGDPATPRPVQSKWSPIVRQPGRGPTLRLSVGDGLTIRSEAVAAVASVWPELG
jgi:hypothetical protein